MFRFAILMALVCQAAEVQSPLERAVTLARERRYAEAQRVLQGVAEPVPVPQRIAFHRLKAAVESGLNNAAGAAYEMEQALRLAPSDPALLVATAVAERAANKLDSALEHAMAVDGNATARALAAGIQELRNELPDAIVAWREAAQLDPTREDYRAGFAAALIRNQNFDIAIDALRATLPLFPKSAHLTTLLGIAQFARGDSDEAARTLSAAIALDSGAEPAYNALAQIVLQASAAPNAVIVKQLCGWNSTVCAALRLREAREAGDDASQRAAVTALEQAPQTDIVARCELARAREWTNRLPEARSEMEKCVSASPTPQNHYRMGLIYRRLGFASLAQREMEERERLLNGQSVEVSESQDLLKKVR